MLTSAFVPLLLTLAFQQGAPQRPLAFGPPVLLFPDAGVSVVNAGDLDSDGDLDIVASAGGAEVTILRNQGGAGFGPAEHYVAGSFHFEQIVADLNADARLDIALANFLGSQNVSVLLNAGDGTFGRSVNYLTFNVPNPRAIAAGDLDGDGDMDLLVGDGILTNKAALLNDGLGIFDRGLPFESGGTSIQMALGDLDDDGDLDAISVGAGVWLHRNHGDATFAPAESLLAQQAIAVAIADLGRDGDEDIAVAISTSSMHVVVVFLNSGAGTAFVQASYGIDDLARDIAIADLDSDGSLDIATSHVAPVHKVDVLLNQGDGTFTDGGAFSPGPPGSYPQSLALGDFDGDGRQDIITANQFANPPSVGLLINRTRFVSHRHPLLR